MIAKGPVRDAHSSLAVLIENPAWCLIYALNTMRDQTGKIIIKDWYREVRSFTEQELSVIASEPFDVEEFKKEYGVSKFVADTKGNDIKKALVGMPTCNIAGFNSGYIGEGAKTVLPSQAVVKIDFRLVPDMVPEKQLERLNNHLREHGFSDIEVKVIHGEAGSKDADQRPVCQAGRTGCKRDLWFSNNKRLFCRHRSDVLFCKSAQGTLYLDRWHLHVCPHPLPKRVCKD